MKNRQNSSKPVKISLLGFQIMLETNIRIKNVHLEPSYRQNSQISLATTTTSYHASHCRKNQRLDSKSLLKCRNYSKYCRNTVKYRQNHSRTTLKSSKPLFKPSSSQKTPIATLKPQASLETSIKYENTNKKCFF